MNAWSEENIWNEDLKKLDGHELFARYEKVAEMESIEYAYGVALPYIDYQEFSFVEKNVENILKKYSKNDAAYQRYFAAFTEPAHDSFAQEQNKALLTLMKKWYEHPGWKQGVMEQFLENIKEAFPDFYIALEAHTQKYAWVYYVYMGPPFTEKDFLGFMVHELEKQVSPAELLVQIEEKQKSVVRIKKEFLKTYTVTEFEAYMLELAGKMVWGKPRRKDYQSRTYYHMEKIQKEIGKRLHLTLMQVRSAPLDMVQAALEGNGEVDEHCINQILKAHVCLPDAEGSVRVLYGKDAEAFMSNEVLVEEEKIGDVSELTGTCAKEGRAKGVVKIINTRNEMDKMEEGDILVSVATTPNIIAAMKKAGGIITDEGGLTCHAAIVSRELGIPSVIGTKIATKVLQDGDVVEVDATNGVIKKL
ncbi:MAG: hypothetical protein COU33_04400 [Candidatus Magasanikbacteria bacterium CG10_big_fil_rev_8_21_14_0_10_43_6]|uniref:PEP-utilising enzyme mobile domain-containing protein n=1 Tax=Candidatus Magasanikbacteria bacterium CG10_big_fil_rev_8_21_14_0_10_43_6 TaxID=1974650 RepID=A0A2M6W096_9BACT|nr:MAG: hypothetical protein COU33_04400 [Candidatus Magasanikbacteria bacterium CG10_big_fil_rev_8_21_14_0_10_43_6]